MYSQATVSFSTCTDASCAQVIEDTEKVYSGSMRWFMKVLWFLTNTSNCYEKIIRLRDQPSCVIRHNALKSAGTLCIVAITNKSFWVCLIVGREHNSSFFRFHITKLFDKFAALFTILINNNNITPAFSHRIAALLNSNIRETKCLYFILNTFVGLFLSSTAFWTESRPSLWGLINSLKGRLKYVALSAFYFDRHSVSNITSR